VTGIHVHIGPGALGLGLIVHCANKANLDSHLVTRPNPSSTASTFCLGLTGSAEEIALRRATYSTAASIEQLTPEARGALATCDSVLITSSVGGNFSQCTDLIVELAAFRRPDGGGLDITFITCENTLDDCYEELAEQLEALGADLRQTMVNRLCPGRDESQDGLTVIVRADPHAEWFIEGEPDNEMLERLDTLPCVSFVPDVEPYATRKKWMVNGAHVALALFARRVKQPSIRVVALDRERQQHLIELYRNMAQLFPDSWNSILGNSVDYGVEQLIPFGRTQDDTSRILKRLHRVKVKPFLDDVNHKLAEPARRYRLQAGDQSPGFENVFEVLHEVLLHLESYQDFEEVTNQDVQLSDSADRDAVDAYEQVLTGVVRDDVKTDRVEAFVRRLARHRNIFGSTP
jgi:hypothetical protein